MGRFIQPDTIIPGLTYSQNWNRFSYVNNDPINKNDPSGHFALLSALATVATAAIGGALVGAASSYVAQVASNVKEGGFSKEAFTSVDSTKIVAAAAAGAVGAVVGVAGAAIGAGIGITMAAGAVGGALSGQASRAATNVCEGKDIGEGLWQAEDLIFDGTIGGLTAGLGWGVQKFVSKFNQHNPIDSDGFGGRFLSPDDEIAIFESHPGSGKFKTFDPDGLSAQSLEIAGSPEDALEAAFSRKPSPGEPYWTTTAGKIFRTGRAAYLDGNGSPGHVSIYGGEHNQGEFLKIFTQNFFD